MTDLKANHAELYEGIIERFVSWAESRPEIQAAVIVGSRGRTDHPADAWSDLDIGVFVTDPDLLLGDDAWLRTIGDPGITFLEGTPVGAMRERRVLFTNGCDVDFTAIPADMISRLERVQPGDPLYEDVGQVFGRGYRIVLDKDRRLTSNLSRISAEKPGAPPPPDPEELEETLNDFWYHCVLIAKKLRRGEMVAAHETLEGAQRRLLTRLIRWSAGREGTIWHGSRFMEEWAPAEVRERLPATWAHHSRDDIQRALDAMMDLVSYLAGEIRTAYDLPPATREEEIARYWVQHVMGDL